MKYKKQILWIGAIISIGIVISAGIWFFDGQFQIGTSWKSSVIGGKTIETAAVCGNRIREGNEECDQGLDTRHQDYCNSACLQKFYEIIYYPFDNDDENTSYIRDLSGTSTHAILTSDIGGYLFLKLIPGKVRKALSLKGKSERGRAYIGDIGDLEKGSLSIVFWANPRSGGAIISKRNRINFDIGGRKGWDVSLFTDQIVISAQSGPLSHERESIIRIPGNFSGWNHFAIIIDGFSNEHFRKPTVYVNGNKISVPEIGPDHGFRTAQYASAPLDTYAYLNFGAVGGESSALENFFDGDLDEFHFYRGVTKEDFIKNIYETDKNAAPLPPPPQKENNDGWNWNQ